MAVLSLINFISYIDIRGRFSNQLAAWPFSSHGKPRKCVLTSLNTEKIEKTYKFYK